MLFRSHSHRNTPGYDKLYVEGSQTFNLVKGDNREVKFTCVPANVKVNIKFEDNFFEFYSDCKVNLSTRHLSVPFVMAKEDVDKDAFFKADAAGETLTSTSIIFGLIVIVRKSRGLIDTTCSPKFSGLTVTPCLSLKSKVKVKVIYCKRNDGQDSQSIIYSG